MNKEVHDEFLQPLKNRPDLHADHRFKRELQQNLNAMATKKKYSKRINTLIPSLLTAMFLFIGIYAGYQMIIKNDGMLLSRQGEEIKNNEKIVQLTEQVAKETVGKAFTYAKAVYNGGTGQTQEFTYKGTNYRFMAEEFNSKGKIVQYLEEVYTTELANRIYGVLDCIQYENKLAQPIKDSSTNLLWQEAQIATIKQINDTTRNIQFKVAINSKGSPIYRFFNIEFKYENGWKLNGALPFTAPLHSDQIKGQGEGEKPSGYNLTENDLKIYQEFSMDLDENRLKGLDPRAIAWFYVNAQGDKRYDVSYTLYTDRKDYVQWTKEEDKKIPSTDRPTQEQLADNYTGLLEGEFIQTGSINGYIEFTTMQGKQGFQMIKDEDGIWNVAFMPIQ
ncbi:DL-endopeptidase inhibitor IseA family protein [Neobacillus sp. 179-C4.2 HS]|uniref:DL-endopeptidase inhibitor IseA family protein n=1 Tax=Neobacillus driksii TaxID=3035913 RepID=A0ABV4YRC4_9BACI|nr:DL-endopeptidase inhibitor IseA family protein [Neobacillus sp. 179.-C4.2 HS]MDP5194992.1 DL-endopeptidase inhibitor IseA family protein [Neobacillus sp. 179.-C4.2 HS]